MSETPDWLKNTATEAEQSPLPASPFTLAAPPEAIATAENIERNGETVRVVNPDNPEQWVDIVKRNTPQEFAEQPGPQWTPEIEAMAEQLIAFKRFWQWPAGTRNELVAAKECATLFLEFLRNGDQPQS